MPYLQGAVAPGAQTDAGLDGSLKLVKAVELLHDVKSAISAVHPVRVTGCKPLSRVAITFAMDWRSDSRFESLALARTVVRDATTTVERRPIMAITTRSSISVNPRVVVFFMVKN